MYTMYDTIILLVEVVKSNPKKCFDKRRSAGLKK
jgi:hypothetical protein